MALSELEPFTLTANLTTNGVCEAWLSVFLPLLTVHLVPLFISIYVFTPFLSLVGLWVFLWKKKGERER